MVDQLNAYQHMSDPMYYTLKFVDGHRDDIKAVVMLQRPKDFDNAAVLAQLQEEAGEPGRKRDYMRSYLGGAVKVSTPSVGTQPPSSKEAKSTSTTTSADSKLSSVYAYRKAQGLCYKCGLTYSRGHRCADMVQLRMVEELWQMVSLLKVSGFGSDTDEPLELNTMVLSQATVAGMSTPRTMRFVGHVDGIDVLALLDGQCDCYG